MSNEHGLFNSEGEATDGGLQAFNLHISDNEAVEVNRLMSEREVALLALGDRLIENPPIGTKKLYRRIGEGDERVVVTTLPYVMNNSGDIYGKKEIEQLKGTRYSAEYKKFANLIIAKEGFYAFDCRSDDYVNFSEIQNPFVINYSSVKTEEYSTRIDGWLDEYGGLTVTRNNMNWLIFEVKQTGLKRTGNPISTKQAETAFNQVAYIVSKYIKEREAAERNIIELANNIDNSTEENEEVEYDEKRKNSYGFFRGLLRSIKSRR